MCLGAIGSQTGGSIIRPASFCGVAGLKPTHTGDLDGILPFAPHLDHPGPIARTALDLGLLFEAFFRPDAGTHESFATPSDVDEGLVARFPTKTVPPRLGRLRGFFDDRAGPSMRDAYDRTLSTFAAAGAAIVDIEDPFDVQEVLRSHRTIMAAEAAAGHRDRFAAHEREYLPRIRALIHEGLTVLAADYIRCREHQEWLRTALHHREFPCDVLVMPATPGPAPDPSTTGDPSFNAPWSYTGSPTLSLPIELSADGLPLAIQLIEPRLLREQELIATARWCEGALRGARPNEEAEQ
jgi:aspartyl-tRNA(Asn)/glutamyl-tRNA(Gln) amidotransferase subunit A